MKVSLLLLLISVAICHGYRDRISSELRQVGYGGSLSMDREVEERREEEEQEGESDEWIDKRGRGRKRLNERSEGNLNIGHNQFLDRQRTKTRFRLIPASNRVGGLVDRGGKWKLKAVNNRADETENDLQELFNFLAQLGNDSNSNSISAEDLQMAFWVGRTKARFLTKEKAETCLSQYNVDSDANWNFDEWKAFHQWIMEDWPETWEAIFLTRDDPTICYDMNMDFEYERFLYFSSSDGVTGTVSAYDFQRIFSYMSEEKAEACIEEFKEETSEESSEDSTEEISEESEEMTWDYEEWQGFWTWFAGNLPHSSNGLWGTRDQGDFCYPPDGTTI